MITYAEPRLLIQTGSFIRPTVDNAAFEQKGKIILYGKRGSGKSTFLYDLQFRSLGTEKPIIFTKFDSTNLSDKLSESFMIHYYELEMATKILRFIFDNYREIYIKYFSGELEKLRKLMADACRYINFQNSKDISLNTLYPSGSLTSEYIKVFKKYSKVENLSLIIDRFDWTDGNSLISQKALSEYFKIFDTSIITTDDEIVNGNRASRENLAKKNFNLVEMAQGKNPEFIKAVLFARINEYNANLKGNNAKFPLELLNDEVIETITSIANGNMSVIFNIVDEMYNMIQFGHDFTCRAKALLNLGVCTGKVTQKTMSKNKSVKMYLSIL